MPVWRQVFLRHHSGNGAQPHPARLSELPAGYFHCGQPGHPAAIGSGRRRAGTTRQRSTSSDHRAAARPGASTGRGAGILCPCWCPHGATGRSRAGVTSQQSCRSPGCRSGTSGGWARTLPETHGPTDDASLPGVPETDLSKMHGAVRISLLRLLQGQG